MAQDEISKKVELNWLSAFYGGLLTDKQRQVLTLHCEEDLSLTEIAQEVGISRQGVHDLIKRCNKILQEYESKLHLVEKFVTIKEQIEEMEKSLRETEEPDKEALVRQLNGILENL